MVFKYFPIMMWASPTRHPGEARMMVAKRPRHGFAMILASRGCHPGSARMIINFYNNFLMWASSTRHGGLRLHDYLLLLLLLLLLLDNCLFYEKNKDC
jgi:hypothetical protein